MRLRACSAPSTFVSPVGPSTSGCGEFRERVAEAQHVGVGAEHALDVVGVGRGIATAAIAGIATRNRSPSRLASPGEALGRQPVFGCVDELPEFAAAVRHSSLRRVIQ